MQMDHGVAVVAVVAAGRLASGLRWDSLKQPAIRMLIGGGHGVAVSARLMRRYLLSRLPRPKSFYALIHFNKLNSTRCINEGLVLWIRICLANKNHLWIAGYNTDIRHNLLVFEALTL